MGTFAPPGSVRRISDIAIVGIAGELPSASHFNELWPLLSNASVAISPTAQQGGWPVSQSTGYCRHAGFIDNAHGFGVGFFAIDPVQALHIDPQKRRLLQRLAKSQCRMLRVLTLAAIRCEQAYSRVLHPLDAVCLGLAHTFGKKTQSLRVQDYSPTQLDQQHIDAALYCRVENPNGATLAVGHGATWQGTSKQSLSSHGPTPIRAEGVYLIIGVGRGMGAEVAKYLARNFKAVTILISRSAPCQSLNDGLPPLAGTPRNEQADLAEPGALEQVMANSPSINGVFHSLLHLAETASENMSTTQLQQSLCLKVRGGYRLLEVLRKRPQLLNFIIFFSSVQSYIVYLGQANYTAGCLCADTTVGLFESLLCVPIKVINWGCWGGVGGVDDAYRNRMQCLQIGSIELIHAIVMIERLIVSGTAQLVCLRQSLN